MDGDANEDEEKGYTDNPKDNKDSNDVCPCLEEWKAEDPVVHEQNAQFGPYQVVHVENFGHNKKLCNHNHVFHWNSVRMEPHSLMDHGVDESDNDEVP